MKRKSAGPSFSRRPSFNKKRKLDKAGRTRQRNQRVALLALLFLLALTGIIILVVYHDQRNKQAARTVSEAENTDSSGLQQWMEQGAPYIDVQLLTPNEYSRPQLPLNEVDYMPFIIRPIQVPQPRITGIILKILPLLMRPR